MVPDVIRWPARNATELSHSVCDPQRSLFHGDREEWLLAPPMQGLDQWAVLSCSAEGQRRAREVLEAFIGPAVATLQVGVERYHLELGGNSFEVLATPLVVEVDRTEEMIAAAERLVNVVAGQPEMVPIGRSSVSTLLRDFRLALADSDSESATVLLGRLHEHPQLSRMNRQFLEVEFLARLGRWRELRDREWFIPLLRQRRPSAITEYMLESVWRLTFEQDRIHSWAEAEAAFGLLPDAIRMALDGIEPFRPPVRRLAALRASEQGSVLRLEHLVAADPSIDQWMSVMNPTFAVAESGEAYNVREETAAELLDAGRIADLIECVERSGGLPPDLNCAVRGVAEYESVEFAPRVAIWLDHVAPENLPDSPGFRNAVAKVRSLADDRCEDWSEWCRRVASDEHWPAAVDVARNGAESWGLSGLESRQERVNAAENLGLAIDGPNAESVDQVLDLLCSLAATQVEQYGADALVSTVSVALVYRTPSAKTVAALAQLVEVVLEHAPTKTVYGELAEACAQEEVVTPRAHIASVLDLLDVFVAGVRIEPHFGSFLAAAQNALIAHGANDRLDKEERRLAAELLAEAGRPTEVLAPADAEDVKEDPWEALDGKTVFLYTLLNGLGARFEKRLKLRCPSVRVTHSQERHASDRLRSLAGGADFVVVHTRHAAHAATIGIDQVVSRSNQVLGNGKGLSSLLLTLRAALVSRGG